jgi:hypothetical protein
MVENNFEEENPDTYQDVMLDDESIRAPEEPVEE